MLVGKNPDDEQDELSAATWAGLTRLPDPIGYNPAFPIETFDFIVTDECHRSIYNLWRQVLEYFDASLIGLTATPSLRTLCFFNQNRVMEYDHARAVLDHVNVDYDVYDIRTRITQSGSSVEAGFYVDKRDRLTRARRAELLDQDLTYSASQLDRDVVSTDQIRTVVRTFKDKLFTEIYPDRTHVPKTLVFAKDDNHADDIVQIMREEFGKGNDFCQKVTYRTGARRSRRKVKAADGSEIEQDFWERVGEKADSVLQSFRNSYNPRVAVTVDMIATGTDIRPLEIVMFLRDVHSPNLFEQMKGRGVRVIKEDDLRAVTPDAGAKTHFVVIDPIGICERAMVEAPPLDRNRNIAFEKLIEAVGFGSTDQEILSTLASRLTRLDRQLSVADQTQVAEIAGGMTLSDIVRGLASTVDPDVQFDAARAEHAVEEPTPEQIAATAERLRKEAVKPLLSPKVRNVLSTLKSSYEQIIDVVSQDTLLHAGFSGDSRDRAEELTRSFRQFIEDNKDQIVALQILYSRPWKNRLTYKQVKELSDAIKRPHPGWTPDNLWRAYEQLDRSKVRGSGQRVMTDLVSLVGFAIGAEPDLRPYPDKVRESFQDWLSEQDQLGAKFTDEQLEWLNQIAEHIATSLEIKADDFDLVPFSERGGSRRGSPSALRKEPREGGTNPQADFLNESARTVSPPVPSRAATVPAKQPEV